MKGGETKFLQELILYAASAAFSCLVLFVGLRQLDPNREASKKALEAKKEIAKRLGRPLVQTNAYEVPIPCLYTYTSVFVSFLKNPLCVFVSNTWVYSLV